VTQHRTSEQPSLHAFVGRKHEVEELRAGLNDAMAGRGRLFMLSGESGIGKTRLAEEISNYASALGMRVLWGRCWEGGGAPAYWRLSKYSTLPSRMATTSNCRSSSVQTRLSSPD